ncbi:hypothetical protein E8E11_000404 [Didymella keratinophila]|nr:hypothetical protein E8E11_000404 [Didymella keratinophila]
MSHRTLAQILKDQDEVIRRARSDASAAASPMEDLQQDAWGTQNPSFSTPVAPQGYSDDDIQRMHLRQPPISHYVPYAEPTPPATDSATERAASPPSELDSATQGSPYASIEYHLKHGTDLCKWPASARAFLAPTEIDNMPPISLGDHTQGYLVLCSPDRIQVWAIKWIGDWLRDLCNPKNDVLDMPISGTSMGWTYALKLRMTAIELGRGSYVTHIKDAWMTQPISMQKMCDDGPLIFKTARKEDLEGDYDKINHLLVELCTRHEEDLREWAPTTKERRMWHETSRTRRGVSSGSSEGVVAASGERGWLARGCGEEGLNNIYWAALATPLSQTNSYLSTEA